MHLKRVECKILLLRKAKREQLSLAGTKWVVNYRFHFGAMKERGTPNEGRSESETFRDGLTKKIWDRGLKHTLQVCFPSSVSCVLSFRNMSDCNSCEAEVILNISKRGSIYLNIWAHKKKEYSNICLFKWCLTRKMLFLIIKFCHHFWTSLWLGIIHNNVS